MCKLCKATFLRHIYDSKKSLSWDPCSNIYEYIRTFWIERVPVLNPSKKRETKGNHCHQTSDSFAYATSSNLEEANFEAPFSRWSRVFAERMQAEKSVNRCPSHPEKALLVREVGRGTADKCWNLHRELQSCCWWLQSIWSRSQHKPKGWVGMFRVCLIFYNKRLESKPGFNGAGYKELLVHITARLLMILAAFIRI